jgi:uncharacterized protein (TIGR02647 family)
MPYNTELMAEMNILNLFNLATTQEGIKVHSNATPEAIAAAGRLHEKGLTTQPDGGYLTPIGHEAAEHAQALISLLRTG